MWFEERLQQIAEELGAPAQAAGMTTEAWLKRVDHHFLTRPWSMHEMQLIEEMRELRRIYGHAKVKP